MVFATCWLIRLGSLFKLLLCVVLCLMMTIVMVSLSLMNIIILLPLITFICLSLIKTINHRLLQSKITRLNLLFQSKINTHINGWIISLDSGYSWCFLLQSSLNKIIIVDCRFDYFLQMFIQLLSFFVKVVFFTFIVVNVVYFVFNIVLFVWRGKTFVG